MKRIIFVTILIILFSSFVNANQIIIDDNFNYANTTALNNNWTFGGSAGGKSQSVNGSAAVLDGGTSNVGGSDAFWQKDISTLDLSANFSVSFIMQLPSNSAGYQWVSPKQVGGDNEGSLPYVRFFKNNANDCGGQLRDGASYPSTSTFSCGGGWHNYTMTYIQTGSGSERNVSFYFDGDFKGSHLDTYTVNYITMEIGTAASGETITIDRFILENITIPVIPQNKSVFRVTAKNNFTLSTINSFNVSINNSIYSTINGTIVTPILSNTSKLFNLTVFSNKYFNETYLNYNVSSNLQVILKQSIINITPKELFTNNPISNFTIKNASDILCNVTGNSCIIYFNENNYTLQLIDNTGLETYHTTGNNIEVLALDNKTINISGHGHEIFVFARTLQNATINNFNATISSFNITDVRTKGTTTGVINFDAIHNDYNIVVDAPGYALQNNSINITVGQAQQNYSVYLYLPETNSINFTFYDEKNPLSLLVGTNITLELFGSNTTNSSTSLGYIYFSELIVGDYEAKYTAEGYDERSYFFTVTNRSAQNIKLYLSNSTTTTNYIIRVADSSDLDVENGIVRLQRQYVSTGGQFVTVEECTTDDSGECDMYILESSSINYRFVVLYNDEIVKVTETRNIVEIPGVTTKSITIRIQIGTTIFNTYQDSLGLFTLLEYNNNTKIFSYEFIDGRNEITGGCLKVTKSNLGNTTEKVLSYECVSGTSGELTYDFSAQFENNTRFNAYGSVIYSKSEVIKEFISIIFTDKGLNADDSDDILFTAIILLLIDLTTILIPNVLIQSLFSFGVLFGLSFIGFNKLGQFIVIMIFVVKLVFNFNKKSTKDGEPR